MTKSFLLRAPLSATLFFALLTALVLALPVHAQEQAEDDPVVLQSETITITRSEFDSRFYIALANILAQQGQPVTPEVMAQFSQMRPAYLEELALQTALLEEANRRGLEVDEEAIEAQVAGARQNFEDDEAFEAALQEAGFSDEAQFRQLLRENERLNQVVAELRTEATASDEQLEAWYEENQATLATPEEVCARHILVETREEAEEIAAALEEGGDFAELATEHSQDPGSAARGGDLGCLPRGVTVQPFEEAAFATPLDTVSEPVETQFGYHLILPYERREAGVPPLDEVRTQVRQEVEGELFMERLEELREQVGVQVFEENLTPPQSEEGDLTPPATEEGETEEGETEESETEEGETEEGESE